MKANAIRVDEANLAEHRVLECVGLAMIGDGALAFVEPEGHVSLWRRGPNLWQKMMDPFLRHPTLTRWVGAAEFALGFWIACRQQPHAK